MILHVLCIRDRAADAYGTPTFHLSIGAAERAFADEVNRKVEHNMMNAHPEDFDLYVLGTYDDSTGEFECVLPRMIAVGKSKVRPAP